MSGLERCDRAVLYQLGTVLVVYYMPSNTLPDSQGKTKIATMEQDHTRCKARYKSHSCNRRTSYIYERGQRVCFEQHETSKGR